MTNEHLTSNLATSSSHSITNIQQQPQYTRTHYQLLVKQQTSNLEHPTPSKTSQFKYYRHIHYFRCNKTHSTSSIYLINNISQQPQNTSTYYQLLLKQLTSVTQVISTHYQLLLKQFASQFQHPTPSTTSQSKYYHNMHYYNSNKIQHISFKTNYRVVTTPNLTAHLPHFTTTAIYLNIIPTIN